MMTLASNTPSNIGSKKPEKRVEGEIDLMAEELFLSFSSVSPMGLEKRIQSLCLGKAGVCKTLTQHSASTGNHPKLPNV